MMLLSVALAALVSPLGVGGVMDYNKADNEEHGNATDQ